MMRGPLRPSIAPLYYADSFGPVDMRLKRRRAKTIAASAAIPVVIHGTKLRSKLGGVGGGAESVTVPALWAWLTVLVWDPMTLA